MFKVNQSKIIGKKIIKTTIGALFLFVVIAFGGFEDKAQVNKITVDNTCPSQTKKNAFRRIKYVAPGWEFQEFISDY